MKVVLVGLFGFILGSAVTAFLVTHRLSNELVKYQESRLGFEETVALITSNAEEAKWKIPKIYDIQKSLLDEGFTINRLKVISMCRPESAYELLTNDDNKKVASMMPCRLAVYETTDGKVMITQLNARMVGNMFGGTIENVMTVVYDEQKSFFEPAVKNAQ